MIKFFVFLIFINLSFASECEIESYKNIIKINKIQDNTVVKNSDCAENIIDEFVSFIESADGTVHSNFIENYFAQEKQLNITIRPQIITVSHIKEHIQKELKNDKLIIKKVNSLMPQAALTLDDSKPLHITCNHCNGPGTKDISLNIGAKKYWLSVQVMIKKNVYILNKNINDLNHKLTAEDFILSAVIDQGNRFYFDDIDNVKFYQFNKFLRKGDVVRVNDLTPKTIVKYGDKVKVKVKNSNVQLSTSAVAKSNGKYGDQIILINPKSNKEITAKVIDYNEAEIEL